MLDVELWRIVSSAIQEKEEDLMSYMRLGKHQDITKYREDVGFLNGLKFVQDTVRDIYQPKQEETE